jgi:hypothetical protein
MSPAEGAATADATVATDSEIQDALVAAMNAYVERLQTSPGLAPFEARHSVPQTTVAVSALRLISAAEIELFELAIFDSWHTF